MAGLAEPRHPVVDSFPLGGAGTGTPSPWAPPEQTLAQDFLATRAPPQFYDQVLNQFRSPQNVSYLYDTLRRVLGPGRMGALPLATLRDAAFRWATSYGPGITMMEADYAGRRGAQNGAAEFWSEVRRLNTAFLRHQAGLITRYEPRGQGPRAPGVSGDVVRDADDEQNAAGDFAYQMFEADSLRPPGMEHLNGPGPLWGILEEQSAYTPAGVVSGAQAFSQVGPQDGPPGTHWFPAPGARERFAAGPASGAPALLTPQEASLYGVQALAPEDSPWSAGNPNRTPEQALAEYWGDDKVSTQTMLGSASVQGAKELDLYGRGPRWQQNGGSRYMRYPQIPFWQHLKREGADRGTDTFQQSTGTQMRESGNPVRGWDMDRLWKKHGEHYRENTPGYTSTYLM